MSKRISNRRWTMQLAVLLAIVLFTACLHVPEPRKRVVLIFSDVTSSLLPSESDEVMVLTNKVINSLSPGTQFYVYPVQTEALKLQPMSEGRVVFKDQPKIDAEEKKDREDKLKAKFAELYEQIRSSKRVDPNHSCILYTLEFADTKLKEFDSTRTDFELIYISDMIEECNTTPMGKPVSLARTNISEFIKAAQEVKLNVDLSAARVNMIIPTTTETYGAGRRPNFTDLREFWRTILSHCGLSTDQLEKNEKFYFASELPNHLRPRPS